VTLLGLISGGRIAADWQHRSHSLRKALPGFFLCIFSSLTCLKKPVFSKPDLLRLEGTSQAVLGSSDQRKVRAGLSLFLKSEKIQAVLYGGKGPEYRPVHDF